jgi:hypothetical protein
MPDQTDVFAVAQQVQALCQSNLRLRERVVELEADLAVRNEDNRRLQKMVAQLQGPQRGKSPDCGKEVIGSLRGD